MGYITKMIFIDPPLTFPVSLHGSKIGQIVDVSLLYTNYHKYDLRSAAGPREDDFSYSETLISGLPKFNG